MMCYPIAIEPGTADSAFGVVVPDLPGCFSAGDSLDEALSAADEAAAAWIDAALDANEPIPSPGSSDRLRADPAYTGWTFGVIAIDPAWLDDQVQRINVTLSRRVMARLDANTRAVGETRSGMIARLALAAGGGG